MSIGSGHVPCPHATYFAAVSSISRSTLKHPSHGEQTTFPELVQNFCDCVRVHRDSRLFARANYHQRTRATGDCACPLRSTGRKIKNSRRTQCRKNQRNIVARRTAFRARLGRAKKAWRHYHCRLARQSRPGGSGTRTSGIPRYAFYRYPGEWLVSPSQRTGR